jgi:hypothetical protein
MYASMNVDAERVQATVAPGFLIMKHLNVNRTLAVKPYDSLYYTRKIVNFLPKSLCVEIGEHSVIEYRPDQK